jgi:predicted enzyme related to lactoylglutathione lyase
MAQPVNGSIAWVDLTIPEAPKVRDFYAQVTGWTVQPVKMGKYEDYSMLAASGEAVAGVCHKRGSNANLPPMWLIYIVVENLDTALQRCREMGGEVLTPVRMASGSRFAVIKDPAGACAALWEPAEAA